LIVLQVLIIFLLHICVTNAEQLSPPPNPEQLSEYDSVHIRVQQALKPKANEQEVDLPQAEDQLKTQLMREETAGKLQKRTWLEQAPPLEHQPQEALTDSKLAEGFKNDGPPIPGKTSLPSSTAKGIASDHKSGVAQPTMRPSEGGGPPEP
jgi:hypothetical protein